MEEYRLESVYMNNDNHHYHHRHNGTNGALVSWLWIWIRIWLDRINSLEGKPKKEERKISPITLYANVLAYKRKDIEFRLTIRSSLFRVFSIYILVEQGDENNGMKVNAQQYS